MVWKWQSGWDEMRPSGDEMMNTRVIIHEVEKLQQKTVILLLKFLGVIALLYTLYFCRTLLLPVLVAGFIALFSSPLVRFLTHHKIPHALASLLVVILLFFGLVVTVAFLIEPASQWLNNLPTLGDKLTVQIDNLSDSFNALKTSLLANENSGNAVVSMVEGMMLSSFSVVAGTTALLIMQIFSVFIITYFFLEYGDDLMRNLVRVQGSFSEKKKTVIIFQTVRDDISRYVLVIFVINSGLGIATGIAMALLGVKDPVLWGALAAILNFAPYVGAILLSVILTCVGFIEFDSVTSALLVPGAFIFLNFIESQLVTPTVLGQRFNMNPLLVVLWMFVWGWVWGVIGLLIAIPLLMCFKILASHLNLIGGWINILDSDISKK